MEVNCLRPKMRDVKSGPVWILKRLHGKT